MVELGLDHAELFRALRVSGIHEYRERVYGEALGELNSEVNLARSSESAVDTREGDKIIHRTGRR